MVHDFGFQKRQSPPAHNFVEKLECPRIQNHRYGARSEDQPNFGLDVCPERSEERLVLKQIFFKMNKIERGEEPIIFSLSEDDKEMNLAIESASESLGEFDEALKFSENENFALKIRYDLDNKSEHIWAVDIEKIANDYFGIIDNLPNSETSIKLYDKTCCAFRDLKKKDCSFD